MRVPMAQLPSRTVTFLFTDIEGSTRLLKQLREGVRRASRRSPAAPAVRPSSRQTATRSTRRATACSSPSSASRTRIAAAVSPRPRCPLVAAGRWGTRSDGHSHRPDQRRRRPLYVGLGLHRGARILRRGPRRPGPALERESRAVAEDDLPDGVSLRDLGPHELKDLDRPEHLFQLVAPDLRPTSRLQGRASRRSPTKGGRRSLQMRRARLSADRASTAPRAPSGTSGRGRRAGRIGLRLGEPEGRRRRGRGPELGGGDRSGEERDRGRRGGRGPGRTSVVVGEGAVWVLNAEEGTVSRIDPQTRDSQTLGTGTTPSDLAVGGGSSGSSPGAPAAPCSDSIRARTTSSGSRSCRRCAVPTIRARTTSATLLHRCGSPTATVRTSGGSTPAAAPSRRPSRRLRRRRAQRRAGAWRPAKAPSG